MICVCILLREHPKAQPKVFLEKPGIEPATPGLQGIALIHYTTVAYETKSQLTSCKKWEILLNLSQKGDFHYMGK